jgi:hypothetical protein
LVGVAAAPAAAGKNRFDLAASATRSYSVQRISPPIFAPESSYS